MACIGHIFLIYSSVNGYLSCFYLLIIADNAVMNIGVKILEILLSIIVCVCVCVYLEVILLDHMVALFFNFLRNNHTVFPQWLHHFTLSPTVYKGSNLSTSSPTLVIFCRLFLSSHSGGCEIIFYCGFDLHFPNDQWH